MGQSKSKSADQSNQHKKNNAYPPLPTFHHRIKEDNVPIDIDILKSKEDRFLAAIKTALLHYENGYENDTETEDESTDEKTVKMSNSEQEKTPDYVYLLSYRTQTNLKADKELMKQRLIARLKADFEPDGWRLDLSENTTGSTRQAMSNAKAEGQVIIGAHQYNLKSEIPNPTADSVNYRWNICLSKQISTPRMPVSPVWTISSSVYRSPKKIYVNETCIICHSKKPEVLYHPCGHQLFCHECYLLFKTKAQKDDKNKCSFCRRKVRQYSSYIPFKT